MKMFCTHLCIVGAGWRPFSQLFTDNLLFYLCHNAAAVWIKFIELINFSANFDLQFEDIRLIETFFTLQMNFCLKYQTSEN